MALILNQSGKENIANLLIRTVGFFAVLILDVAMNISFFSKLGEAWIMPILGVTFVFLKTWHFLRMIESQNKTKKNFHFTGWLTMAIISIFATVSFGLALTEVNVSDAQSNQETSALIQNSKNVRLTQLLAERESIPVAIANNDRALQTKEALKAETPTTGWANVEAQKRLTSEIESLRTLNAELRSRTDAIDVELAKIEAESKVTLVEESTQETALNAMTLFSQIFPADLARGAILFFFVIIGFAIEVTMAMALLPPEASPKKEEEIIEEPKQVIVPPSDSTPPKPKQKRKYTKKPSAPVEEPVKLPEPVPVEVPAPIVEKASVAPVTPVVEEEEIREVPLKPKKSVKEILSLSTPEEPVQEKVPTPPEREEFKINKKQALIHDFIMALYENGDKKYLKDKEMAIEECGIARIDANKVFDYLSTYKHEGEHLIEFRKTQEKWYPNFTSQWILNFINTNNIFTKE